MDLIPDERENLTSISLESVPSTDLREKSSYSDKTLELLSKGLVGLYQPNLIKVKTQLSELTTKQAVLIEQLHDENIKLSQLQNSSELQDMINMIKIYQNKLLSIKKDMKSLHERSTKLTKRALRLQQHKEREVQLKNQQLKQEQDLIGKPNP